MLFLAGLGSGNRRHAPVALPSLRRAVPDERRIDQVIAWLKLPAAERPHFITLYYSQPDSAGHENGPESPETAEAVHHVDGLIGILRAGLKACSCP